MEDWDRRYLEGRIERLETELQNLKWKIEMADSDRRHRRLLIPTIAALVLFVGSISWAVVTAAVR